MCQPGFASPGFAGLDLLEQRDRSSSVGHDDLFSLLNPAEIVYESVKSIYVYHGTPLKRGQTVSKLMPRLTLSPVLRTLPV